MLGTFLVFAQFGCAATPEEIPAETPRSTTSGSQTTPANRVDYIRQVRPILEENCYECHGAIQVPSGKFRLDDRGRALEGGRSGLPAILPDNGADSPLVITISGGDGERWRAMPPRGHGLRPEQIRLIRTWIDQGASFDGE